MPDAPLTIWCNYPLEGRELGLLRAGVAPDRLDLLGPDAAGAGVLDADIAFGQPDAQLCAGAARLSWVHLSSAGYTSFDRPAVRAALAARGVILTTSSSVYSEPCAQHVLAFLLADARQLPRSLRHQVTDHAWTARETRAASVLLRRQTVVLVGFGAIARRLAQLLAPFGLEVVAVRRAPRGDEGVPTVGLVELDGWLARADHVVSTLPASDETARFFDAARFGAMRPGAVFVNVGRGATVDQTALAQALDSGRLRAAYLDVTDPEPLPPAHPLWSHPACFITPHTAGGHADEHERLVLHFLANLRRRRDGLALLDRMI